VPAPPVSLLQTNDLHEVVGVNDDQRTEELGCLDQAPRMEPFDKRRGGVCGQFRYSGDHLKSAFDS